jgi:hypothetical protein
MAEARAKNRLLHPRGRGDVDKELERVKRLRGIAYVAVLDMR